MHPVRELSTATARVRIRLTTVGRSLVLLRRLGFLADVVERWLPKIERRRDLFGFGDVLAVHPRDKLFLIVQATSLSNVGARLTKAKSKATLKVWLHSGGQFEVWGWC